MFQGWNYDGRKTFKLDPKGFTKISSISQVNFNVLQDFDGDYKGSLAVSAGTFIGVTRLEGLRLLSFEKNLNDETLLIKFFENESKTENSFSEE